MADAIKGAYDLISNQKKKEGSSIHPKDFFWDQFLKYISSAILALTVLNVTVEFLRGGGVSCFPPSDNVPITARDLEGKMFYDFGRDQASYINNYCARGIPNTEYFPIYILVHGLLLIVPHFIWSTLHNGDFDSFFSIVEKLDRLRDSKTGEYDTNNFDRVTKLEQEYSGRRIYYTYILKLLIQLIVCIGSVVFSATFFHNFSFIFFCPGDPTVDDLSCPADYIDIGTPCGWPLNLTVPCVYTSLRVLSLIRYADYLLLVIAAGLVLFGFVWCIVRHTEQLGYSELAKFSFQSCLKPDNFVFPSVISWPTYPCFAAHKTDEKAAHLIDRFWLFTHYPLPDLCQIFKPRILHDLDFLLLMLFRADTSHGQVFKDIQTTRELKSVVGRDHQLLHLYINTQLSLSKIGPSNEIATSNEQIKKVSTGCCSCFARLFQRRRVRQDDSRRKNISIQEETDSEQRAEIDEQTATGDQHSPRDKEQLKIDPQRQDKTKFLHKIFLQSGFHGNAERIAYEHYKPHIGRIEYLGEYMKGIRDVMFWFVTEFGPKYQDPIRKKKQPRNFLAMDISFGSIGYSLILARPFIKVVSVNFQPHYQNTSEEAGVKQEFHTNYVTFKFPSNLYAQSSESVTGAQSMLLSFMENLPKGPKNPRNLMDFLVIGPITEESKLVSVNLLLSAFSRRDLFVDKAILLAIRPLKIGRKKVLDRFFKYEPSESIFDHKFQEKVAEEIPPERKCLVDGCLGISIDCGTTPCVFEMIAYQYTGENIEKYDDDTQLIAFSSEPKSHSEGPGNNDPARQRSLESEADSGITSPISIVTSPKEFSGPAKHRKHTETNV